MRRIWWIKSTWKGEIGTVTGDNNAYWCSIDAIESRQRRILGGKDKKSPCRFHQAFATTAFGTAPKNRNCVLESYQLTVWSYSNSGTGSDCSDSRRGVWSRSASPLSGGARAGAIWRTSRHVTGSTIELWREIINYYWACGYVGNRDVIHISTRCLYQKFRNSITSLQSK